MQTNIIYNRSSLSMPEIDNNSIDTIVTSCPYWGLRDYGKGANQIWDADPKCKHQWSDKLVVRERGSVAGPAAQVGNQRNPAISKTHSTRGQFCQLCGAWYGQLGLEPTLEMYIEHLLLITAECKRVLKPTGVLWWNHGDCYSSGIGRSNWDVTERSKNFYKKAEKRNHKFDLGTIPPKCLCLQNFRLIIRLIDEQGWVLRNTAIWEKPNSMPSSTKDRLTNKYEPVFFLVKNTKTQYYWNEKTGIMVSRKPSKDKQKEGVDWDWQEVGMVDDNVFNVRVRDADKGRFMEGATEEEKTHYGKSKRKKKTYWHSLDYWFDLDAIREPHKQTSIDRLFRGSSPGNKYSGELYGGKQPSHTMSKARKNIPREIRSTIKEELYHQQSVIPSGGSHKKMSNILTDLQRSILTGSGKNPGDMWSIPTQSFKGAHFATFPEKLVIRPILSSCPEWICKKCRKARVRITRPSREYSKHLGTWTADTDKSKKLRSEIGFQAHTKKTATTAQYETVGWTDCGCNAGWRPGITLDLFAGSGTTLAVAKKHGRQFIGYEIVKNYIPLIKRRMAEEDTMFNRELKETFI